MIMAANYSAEERFARSAAAIALHNFQWQHAAFILFNSSLLNSVDIFLLSYKKNVIVGSGTFFPRFVSKAKQYVMFGYNLPDIVQMLSWMQRHQFDNTGPFVIVCQSETLKSCNESDIVKVLWDYKIINVVLINDDQKGSNVNLYTYFHPDDCGKVRPTKIENAVSCFERGHRSCRNMFPPKLKNLHQCPILVSTFGQPPYMNLTSGVPTGTDGDLLHIIAKAMNFTLKIMTPREGSGWGKIEENGTWTGSLGDVYYGWANFSMTSASLTLSRYSTFQISKGYGIGRVAWVTHPSVAQPSSLKLLRPFQPNVHIALGMSLVMVVVLTTYLKSENLSSLRRKLNITFPRNIIFHSWQIFMGLPVCSFPANNALLCLTLFWIWYCFLVRTLYQVYLINCLKTDVYSPEFDTIEEAIASKYPWGGGEALKDYFVENPLVYDDWINVESNELYTKMTKMSQGLKFVLAMNPVTTKTFLALHPERKLHILPQAIAYSPSVLFFKKYSPLVNPLNNVLIRLREAGITSKIFIYYTHRKKFNKDSDNIPISLQHYTGCYIILLTGWVLSTLCFIAEILMPKNTNITVT